MRINDIIIKKRDGKKLSEKEIKYFVNGFNSGEIPDYQISALLMAIYLQKMDFEETYWLTMAIKDSGSTLDLSGINGPTADKHSTGGVGDKTTLVLIPMLAALGVKMAKMSGRGLGFSGGTIDKLESFPGFSTSLAQEEFINEVNKKGLAITGQTGNLAPADKKIYALRDITGTVENISLISSSIMGKKLAAGADAIVLDVKVGSGSFMKSMDDAVELAETMIKIGKKAGKNISAIISDMNEPLGNTVGNALEVKEAIDTLKGNGPEDLMELCLALGTQILKQTNIITDKDKAVSQLKRVIDDGSALEKMADLIENQGGNRDDVYNYKRLPNAKIVKEIIADKNGYVSEIRADEIGRASVILGAGRQVKGQDIDLSVGIVFNKKCTDKVYKGDILCCIHGNDLSKINEACQVVASAYEISDTQKGTGNIIKRLIE